MIGLKLGQVLNIRDIKIIPIEEVKIYNRGLTGSTFLYASKKPFALVIQEKERIRVLDINSNELSLESLINDVDGLKDILNN